MKLEDYLIAHYSNRTKQSYLKKIAHYLKIQAHPEKALYKDVFEYIQLLRKQRGYHVATNTLQAIKAYYNYLQKSGQRKDHPCQNLVLKNQRTRDIQLQDLLSEKELESLLNHPSLNEGYLTLNKYQLRNKCILQLLIYQGIQTREIINLKLENIDLEKGTIYIKSSTRTNARELKLHSNQILNLYAYKMKDRSCFQASIGVFKEHFFLTDEGSITNETVCIILRKMQADYLPKKLNPVKVRQSVIANKLKHYDLRVVQAFSGHKTTGSLQRYQQTNMEELKASINKYHPLN